MRRNQEEPDSTARVFPMIRELRADESRALLGRHVVAPGSSYCHLRNTRGRGSMLSPSAHA